MRIIQRRSSLLTVHIDRLNLSIRVLIVAVSVTTVTIQIVLTGRQRAGIVVDDARTGDQEGFSIFGFSGTDGSRAMVELALNF